MPRARAERRDAAGPPDAEGSRRQAGAGAGGGDAGKGRALALLTDSAWHWGFLAAGEGDDGRAFQRFWENAIRWLVRDPALTLLRLELDRMEYRRNQPIVGARARDARRLLARAERRGDASTSSAPRQRRRRQAARAACARRPTPTARRTSTLARCPRAPTALTGRATIDGRSVTAGRDLRGARGRSRAGRRRRARPRAARAGAGVSGGDYRYRGAARRQIAAPRARSASAASSRSRSGRAPLLLRSGVADARMDAAPPLRPQLRRKARVPLSATRSDGRQRADDIGPAGPASEACSLKPAASSAGGGRPSPTRAPNRSMPSGDVQPTADAAGRGPSRRRGQAPSTGVTVAVVVRPAAVRRGDGDRLRCRRCRSDPTRRAAADAIAVQPLRRRR